MTDMEKILEKITNGVAIVTTMNGNIMNGLSVAWMSRVSLNPPLVMVALGKQSFTNELIHRSNVFAVNLLSNRQVEIAKHFGLQSGRNVNKFSNVEYEIKKTGSPVLKYCIAYLDCKLHKSIDVGDHTIFVGEIADADIKKIETPLIYNSKDY